MTENKITIRIIDDRQSVHGGFFLRAAKFVSICAIASAAFFAPGVLADSAAMQWAGFVVLLVLMFMGAHAYTSNFLTFDEARKKLNDLEATQ